MGLYTNSKFEVDVWFCFGSFFYGFESHIYDLNNDTLRLVPKITDNDTAEDTADFFASVFEKPKGLINVELRVYCPEKFLGRIKFDNPIFLFTDVVPRISESQMGLPIIDFSDLRGISDTYSKLWEQVSRKIWNLK